MGDGRHRPGAAARVKAILEQLEGAAQDYVIARADFERSKTTLEAAREKLSAVKRIAMDVLDRPQWYGWQNQHEEVRYAGTSIGDAIRSALWKTAADAARAILNKKATIFYPALGLDEIAEVLESGGFEFRTATPKREIHAACIKLDGVQRDEDSGRIQLTDAYEVLETIVGKDAAEAAMKAAEEDVPF
jgi:hypothetical protein